MSKVGFLQLAMRDAGLLVLAWVLWNFFAHYSAVVGPLGDFTGFMLGALLAICAHLVHEWGHLLGGFAGGSVMSPGRKGWRSLSLFVYSSSENSRNQFLLMSFSGFAATALVAWFAFTQMPADYLATRILRGFSVLQIVLAIVIEMPLVIWSLVSKGLPPIDKTPGQAVS